MKVSVAVAVMIALLCFLAVPLAEGGELDEFARSLNVRAAADSDGFKANLTVQFRVPRAQVEELLGAVDKPADAYMCLQMAKVANVSTKEVLKEYHANKGRGWGVIAKRLGIKPGSEEFHELKSEYFRPDVKGRGKGKGRGGGGVVSGTSVRDSFTDTSGAALDSHEPELDAVGSGWEAVARGGGSSGGGDIQSNQARLTIDNAGHVIDSGLSDAIVEVDYTPAVGADNRNGIVFRMASDENWWWLRPREPNGDITLAFDDGSYHEVGRQAYLWTEGQTYHLKVVLNGTSIKCYVDDELIFDVTDSAHEKATKHGILRFTGADEPRFDNFVVNPLPPEYLESGLSETGADSGGGV